jgi:ABC-type lipoprotein release transport system permease subunit
LTSYETRIKFLLGLIHPEGLHANSENLERHRGSATEAAIAAIPAHLRTLSGETEHTLVLAGVVLAMALVGLLVTWIPAQRALSVNPLALLREE